MIPPISPSTLEANPQFASLHERLITSILNPDASTRASEGAQATVSDALHPHLIRSAKEEILRSTLGIVAAASQEWGEKEKEKEKDEHELTRELREQIGTIFMLLNDESSMSLSRDDHRLLQPDIDAFHKDIYIFASAVSRVLQTQHSTFCKIASASQPQLPLPIKPAANSKRKLKYTENDTPSLSHLLAPLLHPFPHPSLQLSLSSLTATTIAHTAIHRCLLSTSITHSERLIHGLQTRRLKARSAHLSAVAVCLARRVQVLYLTARRKLYAPNVQAALGRYGRYLEGMRSEMEQQEGLCREEVETFDEVRADGGQRGIMREVGRRYGELLTGIEGVKEEIEKLKQRGEEEDPYEKHIGLGGRKVERAGSAKLLPDQSNK